MPPMTVTSSAPNPVTGSEKVNVAVNVDAELIAAGTVMVSVGAVASFSTIVLTATAGAALPAALAASSSTINVTSTLRKGVTSSV